MVASKLGHRAILIDQNPDYLQMARDRIAKEPTRLLAVTASVKKPKPARPAHATEGRYRCEATLDLLEPEP